MRVGSIKKTKDIVTSSFLNTSKEGINNKNDNNRAYFNFINSIKSPHSRKTYEFIIKKYMQYYNIQDINELLADKNNPIIIENNIIDWLVALRDTVEYNTRYSYYTALMTFYEVNDVILRKKKISRFLGQQSTRRHKDRAYERSFADFLPLLPTGSEIKVGIIDYIIKIVGGALTFGLLAIALRRKFERKYTR